MSESSVIISHCSHAISHPAHHANVFAVATVLMIASPLLPSGEKNEVKSSFENASGSRTSSLHGRREPWRTAQQMQRAESN